MIECQGGVKTLLYDDLAICARDVVQLQEAMNRLHTYCTDNKLAVNVGKTKTVKFRRGGPLRKSDNLTTNLAAVVCVCAQFDQFLPGRSYFESIRPENFVRIAKFPYAAFGPLFAFHCPLFFTRNNDLECKSSRFAVVVRRFVADNQLA